MILYSESLRAGLASHIASQLLGGSISLFAGPPKEPERGAPKRPELVTISLKGVRVETEGGAVRMTGIPRADVLETGNVKQAILRSSQGEAVLTCDVGTPGSGSTIELSATSLVKGGVVEMGDIEIRMI